MFEQIEILDRQLLQIINSWNTSFLDVLMWQMTKLWIWIPLFAWTLYKLWKYYKKNVILILAFLALSIVFTDQSSVFIKNRVQRYRPTHNLELKETVHLHQYQDGSVYRGGKYGFVSSHAANSFGIVVLLMFFFYPIGKKYLWIFPTWAIIFCYTRIYLAAHYPLDILCGAILGLICGLLTLILYRLAQKQISEHSQ